LSTSEQYEGHRLRPYNGGKVGEAAYVTQGGEARPALFRQIGIVLCRDKPRTPVLDAFLATLDDLRRSLG